MEEAQRQFLDKGITITYEYMAPEGASAEDQTGSASDLGRSGYRDADEGCETDGGEDSEQRACRAFARGTLQFP